MFELVCVLTACPRIEYYALCTEYRITEGLIGVKAVTYIAFIK